MDKQDYIYTDKNGHKIHIVSLVPNKPKRLLLIPPLVGANGILAIKTFRYFFREGCILMSFDYCGHYPEIDNKFTIEGTFVDTRAALNHACEYAAKLGISVHAVGACYGLIPLLYVLNELGWPQEVKSIFSVNGLLNIHEILGFDGYKLYLRKKGLIFKNKEDFISCISTNKSGFISNKEKYIDALTEYLLSVFAELKDIISYKSFGVLDYSRVDSYKTAYQFFTIDLPEIIIPRRIPCLFFLGAHDAILNLQASEKNNEYLNKIKRLVTHARFCHIRIDHFGRGEDHYVIGKEGMKFLIANDSKAD